MRFAGLCALAIAMASAAAAQGVSALQTGGIDVEVRDPSGAPVQASGKLAGISNGTSRNFETTAKGVYAMGALGVGRYRLEVSKEGFTTESRTIEVRSGAAVRVNISLALASQESRVYVVAPTPLAGTDLSVDEVPAPVQTATAQDIAASGSLDLSDLLNKRFSGVNVNQNQENPFQPDVNYRGYTASPLLGTPEGISVYMDGVRQNQPFADVVAWDLIPKVAISEMALMPGSNPLFGLNTLGGAISIETKDGRSDPGTTMEISGGSFGRREGAFEHGGSKEKGWHWYVAGTWFREDGWRQFSPSQVRQAFGKLGYQSGNTSLSVSFGYADNWLTGNGLQDERFATERYSSVYTIPDITWDRSPFVNVNWMQNLRANLIFSAVAYFRYIRADTTNGNINNDTFDQPIYDLSPADVGALTAAGYSGFPVTGNAATEPFPYWQCIAQGLEQAEPANSCTAITTNTYDKQHNYGLTAQATWLSAHNHFTAGAAWDRSSAVFEQGSQFGYLDGDGLTITLINSFANGTTTQDGVPVDTRVSLRGTEKTYSFFGTDTLNLGHHLTATLSGRYNHVAIKNIDRLPVDLTGARGSLNGEYSFQRFNPAAGLTYTPYPFAGAYVSYSESSRAPTAIELGCANPNEPCILPNALVSDPPLKQVVTRTFEAGFRSGAESGLHWSAGWFRAENSDDLLFVAAPQTGFGYFANFGQTRREGAEVDVHGSVGRFVLGGGYTFLNATYQSAELIGGASNRFNDAGAGLGGSIAIAPGDLIPQIPRNILKAYADYTPTKKLSVDMDFTATGRSYARGNENNQHQPDGVFYLGPGYAPGYGVVNLGAHYQVRRQVQLFLQIDNLLNRRYYDAAQLAPTPFDNARNFIAQPFPPTADGEYPIRNATFVAPGAPIGAWGGVRVHF